ncbi:MMPL family transporter [Nonomuraea glycinis]|uniref:MMPL family transporter n=1 Tax=Nonomuraea glycinis TaxID=2047744 RepID=UPI002E0DEE9B|nr:MMPL family transporter [Nonomuraea glycinis]
MLIEVGVLVAFGILLDALLVRSVLVPALALLIGRRTWWPSRLSRPVELPDGQRPLVDEEPALQR